MSLSRALKAVVVGLFVIGSGVAAWSQSHDAGLVVSIAWAVLYSILWTLGLPRPEWVSINEVRERLNGQKNSRVNLNSPCQYCDGSEATRKQRHVHFAECLELQGLTAPMRMYGVVLLGESFLRDIRYQWLFGVISSAIASIVFVTASRGSSLPPGDFDPWKAAVAGVIGLFHLGTSTFGLAWFRKRAEECRPVV